VTGDWRVYRPAIWLAMLGVVLALLVNQPYIGAVLLGAAIGIAVKIARHRRRASRDAPPRRGRRR
jgi:4-amino-4-deoxy-L-arabinose transferase-like glycosyltransferase